MRRGGRAGFPGPAVWAGRPRGASREAPREAPATQCGPPHRRSAPESAAAGPAEALPEETAASRERELRGSRLSSADSGPGETRLNEATSFLEPPPHGSMPCPARAGPRAAWSKDRDGLSGAWISRVEAVFGRCGASRGVVEGGDGLSGAWIARVEAASGRCGASRGPVEGGDGRPGAWGARGGGHRREGEPRRPVGLALRAVRRRGGLGRRQSAP